MATLNFPFPPLSWFCALKKGLGADPEVKITSFSGGGWQMVWKDTRASHAFFFFFWSLVKPTLSISTVANLKSQILTSSYSNVWAPAPPVFGVCVDS